jgi:hypothetical protein
MEAGAKLYLRKSDLMRWPQIDNNALYVLAIVFPTSPSSLQQQRKANSRASMRVCYRPRTSGSICLSIT